MVDGKSLLRNLRELLNESSTSGFIDKRTSYGYLYQAAVEFVRRTRCLRNEQSITTVAGQTGYTLNADFLEMYLRNQDDMLYLKYNDGTTDHFITYKKYEDIVYENDTSSTVVPDHFSVIDDSTEDARLTGTATLAGASSGGESVLTDASADFSDVSPGDIAHNTTDGSDGVVVSKTSSNALVTALFDGTDDDWSSGDSYVIQPQSRLELVFSNPPSTSSNTVTVYYVQRPSPVFSDYGIYRIQSQFMQALVFYATWLYKYRDMELSSGDRLFQYFDLEVRKAYVTFSGTFNRKGFSYNPKQRSVNGN